MNSTQHLASTSIDRGALATRWRNLRKIHPLVRPFRTFGDLILLSARRLRYYGGLSLLSFLGVILAIALVSSAAFFSQAVDTVIMRQELAEYSRVTGRPAFSSRVFAASSRTVPLTLERTEELGNHVVGTLTDEVGLPLKTLGMMADSGVFGLQPLPNDTRYAGKRSLGNVNLVYLKEVEQHITIDGAAMTSGQSGEALDVWMNADLGAKLGMQKGDRFTVLNSQGTTEIPIQLAGFWRPNDVKDVFWFSDPDQTLRDKLLVRRQDYLSHVESRLEIKVRSVTWYVVLDEMQAVPGQARRYVSGFQLAATVIGKYLPDARLTAPTLSLEKFIGRQTTLTTLLLGFNVPALGFLLYFLVLSSAVIAYWQRRESAILISRGMTRWGVLGYTLVEGIVLFVVGSPVGLGLGMLLARLMGYTVSFLDFRARAPLPVSLEGLNLPLVGMTLGILLLAKLWTAALTGGQTVLSQEREHARPPRGPFWYRAYLDLLLLIPAVYGYQQLLQQGSLGALVEKNPEELYQDPLLIVVPGLFVIVFAFLSMRLFPILMRLLDWLAHRTPWLTLHLALRQLGRYSQNYITPMLLVIVALALGVYTISMAASLDQWLVDRMYYSVGADLTFTPFLESDALSETYVLGMEWAPPPGEFLDLKGVAAATRVGDYKAEFTLGAQSQKRKGRFLALDRVDFPKVAWFRNDLANESLGALMNRLALLPEGILMPEKFLAENNFHVGDRIDMLVITDFGASLRSSFTIAGTFRYFPTVYEDQVTVIGNLDYLFSFFNLTMPHRIWLRLQPGTAGEEVLKAIEPAIGIETIENLDTPAIITKEQAKMERVGVFGTLSVGFIAASFMAALGLLTYSYASLHERLYLFSVMRSIGLARGQVVGQVALEYAVLTAYGALAGVVAGSLAAELFVPLFRVTGNLGRALPPLLPIVAQEEIIPLAVVFSGLMIILEVVVLSSALYQKLFSALRLGHQG